MKEIDGELYIEDGPECSWYSGEEETGWCESGKLKKKVVEEVSLREGETGTSFFVGAKSTEEVCPVCRGTKVIPLSKWTEAQLEQYLIDYPPTDWEHSDWTEFDKFFVVYDREDRKWYVGYDGHGGYTTLGCNEEKIEALRVAVKNVANEIKQ